MARTKLTKRRYPAGGAVARIAARDMETVGAVIPNKGAAVLSIAMRDPEAYKDSHRLWFRRPLRSPLSFGFGAHMSTGIDDPGRIGSGARRHAGFAEPVFKSGLFASRNPRLNLRGPDAVRVLWN